FSRDWSADVCSSDLVLVGRQRDQLVRPALGRAGDPRALARGWDHLPRLQGRSTGGWAVIGMLHRIALHPAVLWTLIALAAIKIGWGSLTWDVWHVLAGLGALGLFWYALRHAR